MQTINEPGAYGKENNSSYNSYIPELKPKLSKTERLIVAVLEKDRWKLSPDTIRARIMEDYHLQELSPGTIRPLLRNLANRGVICNPEKGYYCDRLTYDVAVKPVAVHNIRLHADVECDLASWKTTVEVGGAEIFVQFGARRGIISGWIKYDRGLNRPACMLALDKWQQIAEEHLGRKLYEGFVLTRYEVNRDDMGASFDGTLTCATMDVLKDVIVQRVYEKEDCLRQEYCIRKNVTPQQLDSLFLQGMDTFLASVVGHEQDKKLTNVVQAQKHMNSKLEEIDASNRAIAKKIISGSSGEDLAFKLILELKEENRKTLSQMAAKHNEVMDLLVAKSVENEELKRLVLNISKAASEVVDALAKARQPQSEQIPSNLQKNEDMKNYVR